MAEQMYMTPVKNPKDDAAKTVPTFVPFTNAETMAIVPHESTRIDTAAEFFILNRVFNLTNFFFTICYTAVSRRYCRFCHIPVGNIN